MAKAAPDTKAKGGAEKGKSHHRSPNYPLFDLEKAVERTKELHDADKTHKVPIGVVHERWGYKKHSAAGNQAVAAVKSYGLIDIEGAGEDRKIAVSDRGRRIVLGAPDRAALLKEAAVGPSLFSSLWERYRDGGVPSDDVLRHHLIFDRNFNEDFVANAVDRFKATVGYAGLVAGDKIDDGEDDDEEPLRLPPSTAPVRVGSIVQWLSGGRYHFEEPKRVAGISGDGRWAFVEGSPTGIPMDEVFVDRDHPELAPPQNPHYKPNAAGAQERLTLDEGPVVISWPEELSASSVEDFTDWIEVLLKRLRRKAGLPLDAKE